MNRAAAGGRDPAQLLAHDTPCDRRSRSTRDVVVAARVTASTTHEAARAKA